MLFFIFMFHSCFSFIFHSVHQKPPFAADDDPRDVKSFLSVMFRPANLYQIPDCEVSVTDYLNDVEAFVSKLEKGMPELDEFCQSVISSHSREGDEGHSLFSQCFHGSSSFKHNSTQSVHEMFTEIHLVKVIAQVNYIELINVVSCSVNSRLYLPVCESVSTQLKWTGIWEFVNL